MQPSFFDFEDRWENLCNLNAAQVLVRLNSQIDGEVFRAQLETIRLQERKSNTCRKPFDVILMFKIMVLQSLYNLSDEQAEFSDQRPHAAILDFFRPTINAAPQD